MKKVTKVRGDFIEGASLVLQHRLSQATGGESGKSPLDPARCETDVHEQIIGDLMDLIKQADDPTPLAKLTDGDITQRVDAVLTEVASGDLTPDEGKRLIGLLQAGFDITELPALIERLNEIEKA